MRQRNAAVRHVSRPRPVTITEPTRSRTIHPDFPPDFPPTTVTMHRNARVAFTLLLAFSSQLSVLANTEIRNFEAKTEDIDELGWLSLKFKGLDRQWLDANVSERDFHIAPAPLGTPLDQVCRRSSEEIQSRLSRRCEHETWIRLDLEDKAWSSFSKFTLRLSWPAFVSEKVSICPCI